MTATVSDCRKRLKSFTDSLKKQIKIKYEIHDDHVLIKYLVAKNQRHGYGTLALKGLLSILDEAQIPSRLYADSTLEPDDPSLTDLVTWYSRMGYYPCGRTTDHWIMMERPVNAQPEAITAFGRLDQWLWTLPLLPDPT